MTITINNISYSEYLNNYNCHSPLSSSQVGSLCWLALEQPWLDWEGLQLQLLELLVRYTSLELLPV